MRVGAPVAVANYKDDAGESWPGVVSKRNFESIQISTNELLDGDSFRIDISTDEITRKRCKTALDKAKEARGRLGYLRTVLLGQSEPKFTIVSKIICEETEAFLQLNDSQKDAIRFSLTAEDFAIIHGPPGTGKTTAVVELIVQAAAQGKKVLACAPSNTAVDNLLMKLHERKQKAVRLGHPARVAKALHSRTLDALVAQDPCMRIVKEMQREAEGLFRQMGRYTRARPAPGARSEMRNEAKRLRADARLLERQAVSNVLETAEIICATTTVDDSILGDHHFDLAVIDEACQSTEPPCWIPICRSEKIVFAGDHFQLPPTVLSKEAAKQGFDTSMMERLTRLNAQDFSRMLNVQYRMHDEIKKFSSSEFYDNQLTSDDSVAAHLLNDLYETKPDPVMDSAVLFVDTAGAGWDEELEPGGESRRNVEEANFIVSQTKQLNELGLPLQKTAIIVPYAAQVRLIRELATKEFGLDHRLEIDTVDGFQGREKEAVLISLVRSNDKNEIGFLSDTRRMNVALTRAKRKLIVVGDSATIAGNDFYNRMLKYFESIDAYKSVWEYL